LMDVFLPLVLTVADQGTGPVRVDPVRILDVITAGVNEAVGCVVAVDEQAETERMSAVVIPNAASVRRCIFLVMTVSPLEGWMFDWYRITGT
jgi:hypothetical protein